MAQKKTSDVDYSMHEKIMALYELQKIDSQIDEINKVKGELPLEVQDLEDELAEMIINASVNPGNLIYVTYDKDNDKIVTEIRTEEPSSSDSVNE